MDGQENHQAGRSDLPDLLKSVKIWVGVPPLKPHGLIQLICRLTLWIRCQGYTLRSCIPCQFDCFLNQRLPDPTSTHALVYDHIFDNGAQTGGNPINTQAENTRDGAVFAGLTGNQKRGSF